MEIDGVKDGVAVALTLQLHFHSVASIVKKIAEMQMIK